MKRGVISHLERLKAGLMGLCLEATATTGGVERRRMDGLLEVGQDGTWVAEEPYDTASKDDGGWLLVFTKSPRNIIKNVVPDGRSNK